MHGISKYPVDSDRVRRMPRQFGALDRNLIYQGHIERLSLYEVALYALLVCVSDPQGLSYYSDRRLGELLKLNIEQVTQARFGLIQKRLILYERPIYQLLDLPECL